MFKTTMHELKICHLICKRNITSSSSTTTSLSSLLSLSSLRLQRTLATKNNENYDNSCSKDSQHPLKGIRILDLTRIIAGPYCTMVLADLGAEVLKIERPYCGGDESRKWGPPFLSNSKDATYFLASNRNKKSICIDLKRGKELIHELAKKSDVLIENYIPGKLDEYELGYEQLCKIAPQLIYCSLTGYGPIGPYAKRPGYDVIAASMGGLVHITGERNGPPSKVGVAVTDIATGLYAHGAILAALFQRQRTGCGGQKIDVNLFSTQVAMLINVASNYLNAGLEAERWGTAHSSIVPYQSFKTSDGYLTLGTGSDEQFKELCHLLEIDHISQDERFKTNKDRVANREELISLLEKILIKQTSKQWMKLFDKAPFPVGPVNSIGEVFNDEHLKAINLVKTLPQVKDGTVKVVGPPVAYSHSKNDARTAPPILGQHTDQVLKELLGLSEIELNKLRENKIIQ